MPLNASLETRAVHAGEPRPAVEGAVTLPIFQTANYTDRPDAPLTYVRLSNSPNHQAVAAKLAALEEAEAAVVTASGMAAISTALLTFLKPGDHLLVQGGLYGGTHALVHRDLVELGITATVIDVQRPDTWADAVRPTTRLVYCETLSNPLLELGDLAALARFARNSGLLSLIDNTFATPCNFRPSQWGFSLALHSATKYLNGHSDLAAGAVVGAADLVGRVARKLALLGGCLDPHGCFLLQRGLKTLPLRMRQHNHNGQALAQLLEGHPAVARVNYPGLRSHPQRERAELLLGGFGGMLSFELRGGLPAAESMLQRLTVPLLASSLGGVESLVTLPAKTSHAELKPEERARLGIGEGLVRVSAGVEGTADLVADFRQALPQA